MAKDYDQILTRLISILTKLSNHELPKLDQLRQEFNVSIRTVQYDIYNRLISFPIEKNSLGQLQFIPGFSLDKTLLENEEMIMVSLALESFNSMDEFKSRSQSILQKLLYPNFSNPFYVKGEIFEPINMRCELVQTIQTAINSKQYLHLHCNTQTNITVHPYKIANYDGFWYLFAKDTQDAKIKTFMLHNIEKALLLNERFSSDEKHINQVLNQTHSAWFDDGENFDVRIKVNANIAHFFKQKIFLQSQTIVEEYPDGSLLVSFEITHDEDIDNLIKSWLPDIKIISPKRLRDKVYNELKIYLDTYDEQ
ncbi:MAG: WYL domain-containing protein [Campylobacterota bacterium]|nr:WYL domain-containing protein [Campylobacterota bacterium]